ncbi:Ca(2+)/calmodulin-responsive adenylate cyclase [Gryllus bimaculatus]|nr:Ca(2+)/calmodulin-responsive adenylate cyclase [Gryllus bimaculatus]
MYTRIAARPLLGGAVALGGVGAGAGAGVAMDHSVKAMASQRRLALGRLLNRHRFENDELEALYQRYIFKLQHGSVASAVGLFVLLTGVLANLSLAHAHAPTPQNVYHCVHCVLFALLLAFLNTRLMQRHTKVRQTLGDNAFPYRSVARGVEVFVLQLLMRSAREGVHKGSQAMAFNSTLR